jgi:hypothetical protein
LSLALEAVAVSGMRISRHWMLVEFDAEMEKAVTLGVTAFCVFDGRV